jgi:hypothetical protein
LKQENLLRFSLLYYMLLAELKAVKEYLFKNLNKGFIVLSQALYTLPVLFVKKPNRGLQFCINYQKLNTIIWKDWYPLSLINKTLAQISCTKIFTKLDICQTFHQIWIDSLSKDLTTFQTCYRLYKYKVLLFRLTNRPVTF